MIECATGEYPYLRGHSKAYWELMDAIVKSEVSCIEIYARKCVHIFVYIFVIYVYICVNVYRRPYIYV